MKVFSECEQKIVESAKELSDEEKEEVKKKAYVEMAMKCKFENIIDEGDCRMKCNEIGAFYLESKAIKKFGKYITDVFFVKLGIDITAIHEIENETEVFKIEAYMLGAFNSFTKLYLSFKSNQNKVPIFSFDIIKSFVDVYFLKDELTEYILFKKDYSNSQKMYF
jgi:hypothetical protein